jgi:SAM-dependent methyltransferase
MSMWDERYSEPGFAYGLEPNDFLAANAKVFRPGGSVLSWGDGEGRNSVFLAGQGLKLTALDQSEVGLAKARQLAEERRVDLVTVASDLAEFDLGVDAWDGIVSIWCHLPSQVRRAAHAKAVAALKPGGIFLLEAYSPAQPSYGTGGPEQADYLAGLAALKQELTGLKWLKAEEKEREVREGRFHGGLSSVVQLIGRKPS